MLCYRREKHDIPLIVQTCVDEVERRGMDETGIYRVAGVISDIGALRKAFDTGDPAIIIPSLHLLLLMLSCRQIIYKLNYCVRRLTFMQWQDY